MLDGIGHSGIAVEALCHELLWDRWDVISSESGELEILGMEDPGQPRGCWSVLVDSLPGHLHEILDTRSLRGFVKFTLIRAFFGTWDADLRCLWLPPVEAVFVACGCEG